jgi:hypothetical protein
MWTWQDAQVEKPELLDAALSDIDGHGFSGVLAMLRGSRYSLSDRLVIEAARHAADAAHRLGLSFWFALDPRLDQGSLIAVDDGGARYLLTGWTTSGALACTTPVGEDGLYRVRLDYGAPRPQHMLSQVAITFEPAQIERVYAYRTTPEGAVIADTVLDVTSDARIFVQRELGYVEIFGRFEGGDDWRILAVPEFRSTYPELGNDEVQDALIETYRAYRRAGCELDGVFWDEFGYVTGYADDRGRLPYGKAIQEAFRERHGDDLGSMLIYLLLDDDSGHAVRVRRDFYASVQQVVVSAQQRCAAEARELWGEHVESGIHQTWHQDADDLPHGSGDWWLGSAALSGGFTDVGDAERVEEEDHLDEVLAMTVTAVGLARHHERPLAFCNMWGVDYGETASRVPVEVTDWWGHLLTAFGVVWLAHTYGPNGYIDRVTGWGPGYPDHPAWDRIADVNRRIAEVRALVGGALPDADVAVVYPVETLYRIGGAPASMIARSAHRVISLLVRHNVAVDVISASIFASGEVREDGYWIRTPRGAHRFAAVVYPHPDTIQPAELLRLRDLEKAGIPTALVGGSPRQSTDGEIIGESWPAGSIIDAEGPILDDLPRIVSAPPGAVANLFSRPDGTTALVVVPANLGQSVDGEIRVGEIVVEVSQLRGIAAMRFDGGGRMLEHVVHDGRVVVGGLDIR